MTRIVAMVLFEHGSHGHEESYEESQSIESLIEHFESITNKANDTKTGVVFYLNKLIVNQDGTFKLDSSGNRVFERLYINEKLSKSIVNI